MISIYDVAPRTTDPNASGVATHTYNVKAGDAVYESMFGVADGPIFNSDGDYMNTFDEKPTGDTWYQRIDSTETISTSNNRYRKTFYAGRGGHLLNGENEVYAYTAQAGTWTSITTPTPVAEPGWSFLHWVDLASGAVVSNPSSGTTTSKFVAIFVED